VVGKFRWFNGKDAGLDPGPPFIREWYFSLVRLRADGMPDAAFAPVGENALLKVAPEGFQRNEHGIYPLFGGGIHEVFPQPDGKLLAWGYLLTKSGFGTSPGLDFLARLYHEPPATSVEMATPWLVAEPGTDQAMVIVRRLGDTTGPATVAYATRDGSAVAGRDYLAVSGSLSFAPLEVTKSFSVPLLNPELRRQDREFSVTLSDATGLAGISGPTARLVLTAPFGFRGIAGPPSTPRLTIFGSVGSTYLLEGHTPSEHPGDPWFWRPATTAMTLTQEVQTIPDDPSWPDVWGKPQTVFFRLRRLVP